MSENTINTSVANLTSTFIDLATYDELEKYMYGGPDATTYFVKETRKSTWFSQCPVTLARSNGFAEFGERYSCTISRAGDYLLGTWLHVVTPELSLKDTKSNKNMCIAWTPNFMHALVSECSISFNDLVAASFTSEHLDFWAAFTTPNSKAAGYAKMIGAALPTTGKYIAAQYLNLPLPFFFSRDSGVALPTAALPYNEMKINFTFRPWEQLLCVFESGRYNGDTLNPCSLPTNQPSFNSPSLCNDLLGSEHGHAEHVGLAGVRSVKDIELAKNPSLHERVQVWANYAIVSNEERKRMACAPRDMLIEQMQTMPAHRIDQRYEINVKKDGSNITVSNSTPSQSIAMTLRFSHAIKVLFFGAKNVSNPSIHSNYTTGLPILRQDFKKIAVANCGLGERLDPGKPSYQDLVAADSRVFGVMQDRSCMSLRCYNSKNPIRRANLVYENTGRLGLMTMDYYSQVQPYYHATSIPNKTLWSTSGINMYSYSLDFTSLDPMGSTNYGKLTNIQLNFETENDLTVCGNSNHTYATDSNALDHSHASMVETLYLTNNCTNSVGFNVEADAVHGYCQLSYEMYVTAINNNVVRISGGSLGFPIL